MDNKKGKQVGKFVKGNIILTVWENEKVPDQNGCSVFNGFQLIRFYKNKATDKWVYANHFREVDLPNIIEVINQYHDTKDEAVRNEDNTY